MDLVTFHCSNIVLTHCKKLSLDEASPRGNELVVVNADGLQPGCKCIYGPTFGRVSESILHQDYLSPDVLFQQPILYIERCSGCAYNMRISCNVENYHLSSRINHYRVTSSTNTLVSTSISHPARF